MTFSIVARDPQTGAFGVATATAGPMVGALVPHTRQGLGAVATQAMTNPYLAFDAFSALGDHGARAALEMAVAKDDRADLRQVIIVDANGVADGWTGSHCMGFAGHLVEKGVAVAGNLLTGAAVLSEMMASYHLHLGRSSFAAALLEALRAGAAAGGDKRGLGSAALRVQDAQEFPEFDLRVDLSKDPIKALDELMGLATSGGYHEFFSALPRR
jgi:uncharacterized Ntn-hydrolase superfamily protein